MAMPPGRCVISPGARSQLWRGPAPWPPVFASGPRSRYTLFVPEADDLFGAADPAMPPAPDINRPLADRLRPATLSEVVGQDHLLGPEGAITRMLERGSLASLILWGPPGVGKTTIARLLPRQAQPKFGELWGGV